VPEEAGDHVMAFIDALIQTRLMLIRLRRAEPPITP
jgi:hypothetical protein